jgi:general stress protein YciG
MVGTKAGGIKMRDKNLAKNPLFYQIIGSKGGLKKVPKGFAINRELARTAGAKGGAKSKRGKRV